uniref:Uncharacterized protein n=1 Tax=Anopheles culicifacies TaxID=139723 RepID=A0A182M6P2_9DIPT
MIRAIVSIIINTIDHANYCIATVTTIIIIIIIVISSRLRITSRYASEIPLLGGSDPILATGAYHRSVPIAFAPTRYDPVRSVSRHLQSLHRTALAMSRRTPALLHQYDVDEDNDDEDGVCCKCVVHQLAAIGSSSAAQQISVIAYCYDCDDGDERCQRFRQHPWQQRHQPRTTSCPVV